MPKPQTQTAKLWLDSDPLFLDTETTGLHDDAEIVDVAVIDITGRSVLSTLVRPAGVIPVAATRIHGITPEMVAGAPTMDMLWNELYLWTCSGMSYTHSSRRER